MQISENRGLRSTLLRSSLAVLALLAGPLSPPEAAAQCTHIDGGRLRITSATARSGARLSWRARDKSVEFLIADPRGGQTSLDLTAGGSTLASIEYDSASAAGWRGGGTPVRLWRYSSRSDNSPVAGIDRILSRANLFSLKGKGGIVDTLTPPLTLPITMKLTDSEGVCYLARFSVCKRNDSRGTSCRADPEFLPDVSGLVFQSGFEDQTQHVYVDSPTIPCTDDLLGQDESVPAPNIWDTDLENGIFGKFLFCFGGGDRGQRSLDLVPDPDDSANRVLYGRITEPNEIVSDDAVACNNDATGARKARIQGVLRDNPNLQRIDYRMRVRLGAAALDAIEAQSQPVNWLTIAEFWNNQAAEDGTFRVTLNLVKESGTNKPFNFGLKADKQPDGGTGWTDVWNAAGEGESPVRVPLGEWFTLTITVIEGDATSGRVIVRMTDGEGVVHTVGDITNWTYSPDGNPDGFKDVNPLKLYTSGELMCALKAEGLPLEIWWDDFAVGGANGSDGSAAHAFLSPHTDLLH
jgi:hypothetical protein